MKGKSSVVAICLHSKNHLIIFHDESLYFYLKLNQQFDKERYFQFVFTQLLRPCWDFDQATVDEQLQEGHAPNTDIFQTIKKTLNMETTT